MVKNICLDLYYNIQYTKNQFSDSPSRIGANYIKLIQVSFNQV